MWSTASRKLPFSRRASSATRLFASSSIGSEVQRRISHVLVSKESWEQREEALSRLEGGEPFEDVAMEYSICPSKHSGGDLGWVWRGVLPRSVEEVAFSAPLDALVEADSEYGHHFIKVLDERESGVLSQMSAQELYDDLHSERKQDNHYIDCREEEEFRTASIPGFKLYPLSQLGDWAKKAAREMDQDKPVVVMCHHGVRSMQVAQAFIFMGFKDVRNVTGGIDAYSGVDPSVPRY